MTYVQTLDSEELRIIVCLAFATNASPTEVELLKKRILDAPQTVHAVEAAGDYHFMFEVAAPDLPWYNDWLKGFADLKASLVETQAMSFVCRRFVRRAKQDRSLWIPSNGTLKRIDCSLVDKVVADGDYVKIHSERQVWLLHSTMHAIHDFLGSRGFVQLHRSVIVRVGFIDSLTRAGRHWIAHLKDGECETVAQGHVAEVLKIARSPIQQEVTSVRSPGIASASQVASSSDAQTTAAVAGGAALRAAAPPQANVMDDTGVASRAGG